MILDFLFKIMEVLDKDNKIRNAIPIAGVLWIVFFVWALSLCR